MQKDSRNEQLYLELEPEEATESPEPVQSAVPAEKELERKSNGARAIRNGNALTDETMNFIAYYGNMENAFKKVASNKGSAGVDGMKCEELVHYFHCNWQEICESLRNRTYEPTPVLRVEIPKDNGKMRSLGIPTVVDRGVQMAVAKVLERIYEPMFSDNSYGFRPGRSAHDALKKCLEYANDGYEWVVDIDLEKYFDTVPQSKLLEMVSRTIKDGSVISLIYKFMKAGVVMQDGVVTHSDVGIPQGGCLSPLLANIMLDECDKELERRGLRFVRYADDMMIFARSERSAKRIMESITRFIEGELKLNVNREKTVVRKITGGVKFLGHGFWKTKGRIRLKIHEKSYAKLKQSLKEITARKNQLAWDELKLLLKQKITGWVYYFRYADAKMALARLDEWLRHRIRCLIFRRYWRPRSRYKFFVKHCKAPHHDALMVANARQNFWAFSEFHMVNKWVNNDLLRNHGYTFLSDVYNRVHAVI